MQIKHVGHGDILTVGLPVGLSARAAKGGSINFLKGETKEMDDSEGQKLLDLDCEIVGEQELGKEDYHAFMKGGDPRFAKVQRQARDEDGNLLFAPGGALVMEQAIRRQRNFVNCANQAKKEKPLAAAAPVDDAPTEAPKKRGRPKQAD